MSGSSSETDQLLHCSEDSRTRLLSQILAQHRERLKRLIQLRIDRRLQGRLDPSDVIQEAYLEAASRVVEYLRCPNLPFFVWLRLITLQRLALMHRRHLGTQARDVSREVSIYHVSLPDSASAALAAQLLGRLSSPSDAAVRSEQRRQLQAALAELDQIDREVLMLRHFEELSNNETAHVLAIQPSAASNRYVRALKRLKDVLVSMPGGKEDVTP